MIHLLRVCVISVVPALRCNTSTLNQNTPQNTITVNQGSLTNQHRYKSSSLSPVRSFSQQARTGQSFMEMREMSPLGEADRQTDTISHLPAQVKTCTASDVPPPLLPLAHRSCDFSLFQTA